ncbi:hypothetical protein EDB86DRAFT_3084111 [Lactarius hatsudake]|nr:hypothetical protein EDB86DRAFT_3084111 [Lactarius hatsudake]
MTSDGKVQTRLGVIDYDPGKVYGQLVKPPRPITDYLTCFSGITAAFLDPVTMTLPDMQTHLCAFINSSTMTVRSNRICNPSNFRTYLTSALRYSSTTRALGHPMQDRGPGGYDFEEDAHACVVLLKAKIKNRPEFEAYYDPGAHCAFASSRTTCGSNGVRTATGDPPGNPVSLHDEDRNYETLSPPPPGGNGNTLFATVTNLNAHLTAITALLLFA